MPVYTSLEFSQTTRRSSPVCARYISSLRHFSSSQGVEKPVLLYINNRATPCSWWVSSSAHIDPACYIARASAASCSQRCANWLSLFLGSIITGAVAGAGKLLCHGCRQILRRRQLVTGLTLRLDAKRQRIMNRHIASAKPCAPDIAPFWQVLAYLDHVYPLEKALKLL